MPVFNRYAKRAAPGVAQPPEDDLNDIARKRLAAQQPAPALAPAPMPAHDDLTDIAHQRLAAQNNGNAFGNVARAGQQNFGPGNRGGPDAPRAQPHDPRSPPPTIGQGPQAPSLMNAPLSPEEQAAANAREAAKQKARAATEAWARQHPGEAYTPDGLDEVAQARLEHQRERDAREADLRAAKAQALQQADARAGLMGLGLSGGTSALLGDVSRVQERGITEDLANLDRQQRDEDFQAIQRQQAIDALEEEEDLDVNHDGLTAGHKTGVDGWGDGDPENNPDNNPNNAVDKGERELQAAQQKGGGTGAKDDPYGGIGGYGDSSQDVLDTLKAQGVTFTYIRTEGGIANGEQYVYALGSDGKYYKFKVPGTGLFSKRSIGDVKSWFSAYGG